MNWHILTTAPQRELKAQEALTKLGLSVMLPVEYRWHDIRKAGTQKGKKGSIEREVRPHPLFPRYVFAGYDDRIDWQAIEAVHHNGHKIITGALRDPISGYRYRLQHIEALRIRSLCDIEAPRVPPSSSLALRPGDLVRITDGPFSGQLAKVTKQALNKETIRATHALLGSLVIKTGIVEVVERAAA